MITSEFLQFLYELSQNNNRDWFEKNKKRFEATVKKPFEALVGEVIGKLKTLEPGFQIQPRDCIFRIFRDTRFSADKTPYKTHMAAVFTHKGRQSFTDPGYYLHMEFGTLSIGGGAYFLDKEPLHKVRAAIAQDPDAFKELLNAPDFKSKYGEIKGDKNKVLPAEFKEAAKKEPLIANKQFYFMADMDPEICLQPDFSDFILDYFKAGKGLNDYFRQVLQTGSPA